MWTMDVWLVCLPISVNVTKIPTLCIQYRIIEDGWMEDVVLMIQPIMHCCNNKNWVQQIFSLVSRSDLLDDNVLESIETSFKQFHAFLDMLNGAEYV